MTAPYTKKFQRLGSTRWLIAGSLLLNLLLGGVILGHMLHPRHPQPQPAAAMQALPETQRTALEARLRDLRMDFEAEREQMRLARERSLALLTAEPFDSNAYRAQLQEGMNLRNEHQRQMQDNLVALAEGLSPEERNALAETLRRPPPHRHGPPPR